MIVKNVSGALVIDARNGHDHHHSQRPTSVTGGEDATSATVVTLSEQAKLHIDESRQDNSSRPADSEQKPEEVESLVADKFEDEEPLQTEEPDDSGDNQFSLTEEEREQVKDLTIRDREVRAHEQAHLAAAGTYARGGPTYDYQTGPDNRQYAVGGEVAIDTSPVPNDPEATVRKATIVRQAALAPREPSSQDRAVAAKATSMKQKAQAELAIERVKQNSDNKDTEDKEAPAAAVGVGIEDALGAYRRTSETTSLAA